MEISMATLHPRINITFDAPTAQLLTQLAHQKHRSVSSLARELIMEALERHEDIALSALADIRESQKQKRIKHEDAWK